MEICSSASCAGRYFSVNAALPFGTSDQQVLRAQPISKMLSSEIHNSVFGIVNTTSAILHHVEDHKGIEDVLEEAEARVKRIHDDFQHMHLLSDVENVLSPYINEAVDEFMTIHHQLLLIQRKVMKRTPARSDLTFPSTFPMMKEIEPRSRELEQNIKVLRMIVKLSVDLRSSTSNTWKRLSKILTKLQTMPNGLQVPRLIIHQICRIHFFNSTNLILGKQCR